jgi:hypothetical protein
MGQNPKFWNPKKLPMPFYYGNGMLKMEKLLLDSSIG